MAQTVYVVDDDTALRTAYAAALSKMGYEVKTASDGVEGLELVKQAPPALLMTDMLMPNLDGIGMLEKLRADPKNADIVVVVVSNFESAPETTHLNVAKYFSKIQNTPDAVAAGVDRLLQGA